MNHRFTAKWFLRHFKANRLFFIVIASMMVFRSAIADWNVVPTGSMLPTIVEGDRIFVNKMAYDFRVPFTHISLWKIANPARGEIVIFDSKVSGERLVKRVVGVPGDIVEMRDNVLIINAKPLPYGLAQGDRGVLYRSEDLLGTKHAIRLNAYFPSRLSSFPPVKVPSGKYLVLGDNRDNSADSRVIGFVDRSEFVGRSNSVVLSLDPDNYYLPRSDRFFHTL